LSFIPKPLLVGHCPMKKEPVQALSLHGRWLSPQVPPRGYQRAGGHCKHFLGASAREHQIHGLSRVLTGCVQNSAVVVPGAERSENDVP